MHCPHQLASAHGGLVRLLEASIQNIDVDAVADQEERSPVDHCRRSRQRSVLMADLERLLWPVKARPGDQWLGMVVTDDIVVGVAIGTGLGSRCKLYNSDLPKTTCPGSPGAGPRHDARGHRGCRVHAPSQISPPHDVI